MRLIDQELVSKILKSQKWSFLPCPFCGSDDIGVGDITIDIIMGGEMEPCTARKQIFGYCRYCRAQGRQKTADIIYPGEEVAVAVETWNDRRAADDNQGNA